MKFLKLEGSDIGLVYYASGFTGSKWPTVSQNKFSSTKVKRLIATFLVQAYKNQDLASDTGRERFGQAVVWMNTVGTES